METTWDGLPVSKEKPFGAAIVVWREAPGGKEWLVLHRHHHGPDYAGEWAWTPPTGARQPGETIDEAARRELLEETGLELELLSTDLGSEDWAVYVAEAPREAEVTIDPEHDTFRWLPLEDAAGRCLPELVGTQLRGVAALMS